MKNLFGLILLLLVLVAKAYSQGYYPKTDTCEYEQIHVSIKLFGGGVEDFVNSLQQISRPLFSHEEDERIKERVRKEEEARFYKMVNAKRKEAFENIIGLTMAESVKFWPLYDEYLKKHDAIIEKRQTAVIKLNSISFPPEEQANMWADVYVNSIEEEANLVKEYKSKFKVILGRKKLPLLYRAEYQFKEWIIRTMM